MKKFLTSLVLICAVAIKPVYSQQLLDGAKYLYAVGDQTQRQWHWEVITLNKTSANAYSFGVYKLLVKPNLSEIYYIKISDTLKYYDYKIISGQSFTYKQYSAGNDTLKIDSIKSKILNNNKAYKHWFTKSPRKTLPIIWMENLGERNTGLYPYDGSFTAEGGLLKAICFRDTVVFWNTDKFRTEVDSIKPTCDFNRLLNSINTKQISAKNIEIFPNPANKYFEVKLPNTNDLWEIKIMNQVGKTVSVHNKAHISTEGFPAGIYYIQITNPNKSEYYRTCMFIIK